MIVSLKCPIRVSKRYVTDKETGRFFGNTAVEYITSLRLEFEGHEGILSNGTRNLSEWASQDKVKLPSFKHDKRPPFEPPGTLFGVKIDNAAMGEIISPPTAANRPLLHPSLECAAVDPYLPNTTTGEAGPSVKPEHAREATLYTSLPGDNWIRLLILEPGQGELTCRLEPVRLSNAAGTYHALSYCWSAPVSFSAPKLICNGIAIDAGLNLRRALFHIRHASLRQVIWVDAMCINQNDHPERNSQVQMMKSIYEHSAQAIVWLGDALTDGKEEFRAICRVVNDWDKAQSAVYEERPLEGQSQVRPDTDGPWHWQSIARVFQCPWFERRWVIQEVALSPSAVALAPGAAVSWTWIGTAAAIIRTQHDDQIYGYSMKNVYHAYLMFRLSSHGSLPALKLSLLVLLRLTTEFQTSERLDILYGLLGLIHHGNPDTVSLLQVDYGISERKLCQNVVEYLMKQDSPLSFLSDATGIASGRSHSLLDVPPFKKDESAALDGGSDGSSVTAPEATKDQQFPSKMPGPSWLPRWNSRDISMLDPWTLRNDERNNFNAAQGLPFARFSTESPDALRVTGIQFSTVVWTTPAFHGITLGSQDFKNIVTMMEHCRHGFDALHTLKAFSQAMCAGRDDYGSRDRNETLTALNYRRFLMLWLHRNNTPALRDKFPFCGADDYHGSIRRAAAFARQADMVCHNRRLFLTASGHLGLGPEALRADDVVCVLGGAVMPYILRRGVGYFRLVGECYVDGIMDGEVVAARGKTTLLLSGPVRVESFLAALPPTTRRSRFFGAYQERRPRIPPPQPIRVERIELR